MRTWIQTDCQFCSEQNLVDNGDLDDLSQSDIDGFNCWNCKGKNLLSDEIDDGIVSEFLNDGYQVPSLATETKSLGQVTKTERGFSIVKFRDSYDKECRLQQSSAIGGSDVPGESFVWLGVIDPEPQILKTDAEQLGIKLPPGEVSGWMPYPLPAEVMVTTEMHLDREQVIGLIGRLQKWVDTGSFE